jgi:hypothetical protein
LLLDQWRAPLLLLLPPPPLLLLATHSGQPAQHCSQMGTTDVAKIGCSGSSSSNYMVVQPPAPRVRLVGLSVTQLHS